MSSSALLTYLTPELISCISQHLAGIDVKNVRLTCRSLRQIVPLRIYRVFISSSPRDIAVFCAVANHETFRHVVREIVWDEARLPTTGASKECDFSPCVDLDCLCDTRWGDNGTPKAYVRECEKNMRHLWKRLRGEAHLPRNVDRAQRIARQIPISTSLRYYRGLIEEQKQVIDGNWDVQALEYGMARFPNVSRITITPATHGYLFTPLYETPLIRSLPCEMNYYIPHGWPTDLVKFDRAAPSWDSALRCDNYRGFTNMMRVLAQDKHSGVKELVIDACQQPTGISCDLFREPNETYNDFCQVLRIPGFRRLDLALHLSTAWRYNYNYAGLRTPLLHDALAAATELESMHLYTNSGPNPKKMRVQVGAASMGHFIPLQSILPVAAWPQLRHFGLTGFLVCQPDVVALLKMLPPSICTVELNMLYFLEGGGNYHSLLEQMRAELK